MALENKSLPVYESDTDLLFEKFSVEEIRDIEKKTRLDIERKKEDLRTMVGERYRELIEAADTIYDMQVSAENVTKSFEHIDQMCTELKNNYLVKGSSLHQRTKAELDQKKKNEAMFYGVASQIKLLLDMPEKIWSALDSRDYLTAARLYLLSRHINTSLHLDSQHSSHICSWFPVLTRQWVAISHFKPTVLQGCRAMLKEASIPDKEIANSLASILLLEDSSPNKVFSEFLSARSTAVQQLFHPSQHGASVKEQVCLVVKLLMTTIKQVYSVFYLGKPDDPVQNNMLQDILTHVTAEKLHESGLLDLQGSLSAKCLPKSVTDFCSTLRIPATPVAMENIQSSCKSWIDSCMTEVKAGIGTFLTFINTIKRLADIRDAVWELLGQVEHLSSWEVICGRILDRRLSPWEDFFRPLFLDRVKALIQFQLDSTAELTKRQMTQVFEKLDNYGDSNLLAEVDVASYVWSESPDDLHIDMAWVSAANRTLMEGGALMMKSKAFTPVVQNLSRKFDEKLKTALEDTLHYLPPSGQAESELIGPFDRYADCATVLTHIQGACDKCIEELLGYLDHELKEWKSALRQAELSQAISNMESRILLSGRLCGALCDLTPHLQQCMMGSAHLNKNSPSSRSKKLLRSQSKQISEDLEWAQMKNNLLEYQKKAYRAWTDHLSDLIVKDLAQAIMAREGEKVIASCTRWDEISIQEESEQGDRVSSKICVPMQASWCIQSSLYKLCQEINRVGGHSLHRNDLQQLIHKVSDGIIDSFEKLLRPKRKKESAISQHRSLQLLFDIRFLAQIIPRKEDLQVNKTYHNRVQKVISSLEELVDPFDLDVFAPYIQSHLMKQGQRMAILFGALTSLDRLNVFSSSRQVHSSQHEQHNVLQLSSCQSRFPLLPLSTQTNRYSLPQPVLSQTLKVDGGPSLKEAAAAVLPQTAGPSLSSTSSFYNKLGSMSELSQWFSNIGGKS
ncbi:hypothetical protein ScPMuIL_018884 [Solemya velum]